MEGRYISRVFIDVQPRCHPTTLRYPFAPWGIEYDAYNNWFETSRWMRSAGMRVVGGHGVGFGYHKYLLDPFYIHAVLKRIAPRFLGAYYRTCARVERALGQVPPFRYTWEKFVIKATREARRPPVRVTARLVARCERVARSSLLFNGEARRERRRERDGVGRAIQDNGAHLAEAIGWLKRAQDATPDRGVSRGYSLAWHPHRRARGWQPSYPETTGYIIPTFFDCAAALGDGDCAMDRRRRAPGDPRLGIAFQ